MNSSNEPQGDDLNALVSRFLDQTITPEEARELDRRLSGDPRALDRCAEAIRFEASMREAMDPRRVELEEIRRLTFDPLSGDSQLTLRRRMRLGRPARHRRRLWIGAVLGLVAMGSVLFAWKRSTPPAATYTLRNGDFETMDLSQSPSPVSSSILFWQESFSTGGAQLCDFNRSTDGRHYAKSGRNVVTLTPQAFLNQLILDEAGNRLLATPGMRIRVRGWYLSTGATEPKLRCSLRFVAGGYPSMVQYDVAHADKDLADGGWNEFDIELAAPDDLWREPSVVAHGLNQPPPRIDLTGKPLTLSLDNYSEGGLLCLDDLSLEILSH